jgi:predicted nucleotidyltransferase
MTLLMNLTTVLSQTLLEAAPKGLVSAYLFGSHARGQAHSESDIDVGVLLHPELYPSVQARFEERLRLTAGLIGALGVNAVDMVVLNDAPPELGRHIVTQGTRLYCAEAQLDHAFVRDVQLRAADLAPFLRRTRRVKLQALARP